MISRVVSSISLAPMPRHHIWLEAVSLLFDIVCRARQFFFPNALLLTLKTPAAIFNLLRRHIFAVMAISRCLSTFSKPLVIFCEMLFNIIVLVCICSFLFQYSVSSMCGIIFGDQH